MWLVGYNIVRPDTVSVVQTSIDTITKGAGPCLALPPVLLGLTTSTQPFHRFTAFQLLHAAPTLLVDSVSEPIPVAQLGQILLAGMYDASVDVRIEAMKALKSVVQEGITEEQRESVGPALALEAFKASLVDKIQLQLMWVDFAGDTSRSAVTCPRSPRRTSH